MRTAQKRVTMAAIAAAANVPVPTVSKVLNGRADVAAETPVRVESALGELGYAPQPAAQYPAGPASSTWYAPGSAPGPPEIIRGASAAALAAKCRMAVTAVSSDADVDDWLRSLTAGHTNGVILVLTELSRAHRNRLAALQVPVVIVDPVGQPTRRSCRSAPPTGPAAWPRPSTCWSSGTAGSPPSPGAPPSYAARPGWMVTARRSSGRTSPSIRSSSGPATSITSPRSPPHRSCCGGPTGRPRSSRPAMSRRWGRPRRPGRTACGCHRT